MKKNQIVLLLMLITIFTVWSQKGRRYTINSNWEFFKGDIDVQNNSNLNPVSISERWESVNIPHTWNALDTTDDISGYYRGVGWYKKETFFPLDDQGKDEHTCIYFEGVNQVMDLYINNTWVGQHKGGYTRFYFDITNFLSYGKKNSILVKVDNSYDKDIPPLTADFTFFGGIYRDVFLIKQSAIHFSTDDFGSSGVYISTPNVNKNSAVVEVDYCLKNESEENRDVVINIEIIDSNDNVVVQKRKNRIIKKEGNSSVNESFLLKTPKLWSPTNPYLYKVSIQVQDSKTDQVLDSSIQPLGIRWFRFDADKGFFLNGEYLKLIGTNRHQDYLKKGNALEDEFHIKDIRLLKEMGGNFLRIAHYPQDPTILELCDRLGILTSVEVPIVNEITESNEFTKNCLYMTEEMVKQNRNHPSIIIWAYMNEVLLRPPFNSKTDKKEYEKYANNVKELAIKIEDNLRKLDPDRYTMIPNHGAISKYKNAGLTDVPMILGWNLYQGWYGGVFDDVDKNLEKLHNLFPNKPLLLTEYGADVHPRLHSFESERFDYTVEYGNKYHEHYLKAIMDRPFVAGAAIWNLNDFYSETRGYAQPRTNLKGITTLDREKKDTWWLYKTMLSNNPIIKFGQNEWKIRGGVSKDNESFCMQPVSVYSNGDFVELIHMGKIYKAEVKNFVANFIIPFENGYNQLEVKTIIDSNVYKDLLDVDFRMVPNNFDDYEYDFFEFNVLLGSNRFYEDKIKSQIWIPEKKYSNGSWGYVGGRPYRSKTRHGSLPSSEIDILNIEDDPIFQTQRLGIENFKFDVPNGKYQVTLFWSELDSDIKHEKLVYNLGDDKLEEKISDRAFNILINNEYFEKDLNVREEFGSETGVSKRYQLEIHNGKGIDIKFEPVLGEPILNAIRLRKVL